MTRMVHHRPFWDPFVQTLESVHRSWGSLLAFGIIILAAGIFAIIYTEVATLTTVLFVGWLTIFGGITQVFAAFYARQWSGFFLHLAGGILGFIVGFLIITHPGLGALAFTLLAAAYFLVSGAFRIAAAFSLQFEHWGWAALNGVITFILGLMIAAQWPVSSVWVIGLFVGIDLVFAGWTLIALALAARRVPVPEQRQ